MDIKAYLKSGPVDVEYVSRTGPVTKEGKKGPYQSYTYKFRLRSTGETFDQFLFDSDHRKIGYVGPNALIRITSNEKGYPQYAVLPTGDAAMNIPQPRNTAQVATERAISRDVVQQSLEQQVKQKQISLAGVYQARLASGKATEEARTLAIMDVAWLESTALNLAMTPHESKFADELPASIKHTPSVQVADLPF